MKRVLLFAIAIFLFFSSGAVFAQRGSARGETVQIRFASPLPKNSEWGRGLDRIAAEWERVTNNSVRVVVSHDGREGNEARMLSSLSSDSIQAALLTSAGIAEICPAVMTLSIPFFIRNETEFDLILNEVKPILDNRVYNDFIIITWSKGGWVYVFSKEPVLTPDDLRRQKLGSSAEMREINRVFGTMGFQVIETDIVNVGTRLASNTINTIYLIPTALAPMQLHRNLGNMLNMPIAPIMGAIVMNRITWNKINAEHQQEILRVARRVATEFDSAVPRTEVAAISSMGRDGLKVNIPTPAQEAMWQDELNAAIPSLIGTVYDRDIYQRMSAILERARSRR